MRPGKANHGCTSIIDKFDRPSPFVLNPDENDPGGVTRSQFLVWLVPSDKSDLQKKEQKGHVETLHIDPIFD